MPGKFSPDSLPLLEHSKHLINKEGDGSPVGERSALQFSLSVACYSLSSRATISTIWFGSTFFVLLQVIYNRQFSVHSQDRPVNSQVAHNSLFPRDLVIRQAVRHNEVTKGADTPLFNFERYRNLVLQQDIEGVPSCHITTILLQQT